MVFILQKYLLVLIRKSIEGLLELILYCNSGVYCIYGSRILGTDWVIDWA